MPGLSVKPRAVLEEDPEGRAFGMLNWHFGGYDRRMHDKGRTNYIPMNFGEAPDNYRRFIERVDVLIGAPILNRLKRMREGDMSSVKKGFYDKGGVRIRYQEVGAGFPLFAVPGGGLNSRIINWPNAVINMMEEFKADFRVITMDQRNATNGESTGPVPVDNPWDAFADDQLGLMDFLGVRQFAFFGNCIGGSFAMKLTQRAPDRVVAAIISQTIGHLPENPDVMWNHGRDGWAKEFRERRPEVTMATIEQYFHNLYRVHPDFVYSVSREFARNCQTPILVLPDDTVSHPYPTSVDIASLAPNAEVTVYPWKGPPELKARTINRVRKFLKAHMPAGGAR